MDQLRRNEVQGLKVPLLLPGCVCDSSCDLFRTVLVWAPRTQHTDVERFLRQVSRTPSGKGWPLSEQGNGDLEQRAKV